MGQKFVTFQLMTKRLEIVRCSQLLPLWQKLKQVSKSKLISCSRNFFFLTQTFFGHQLHSIFTIESKVIHEWKKSLKGNRDEKVKLFSLLSSDW